MSAGIWCGARALARAPLNARWVIGAVSAPTGLFSVDSSLTISAGEVWRERPLNASHSMCVVASWRSSRFASLSSWWARKVSSQSWVVVDPLFGEPTSRSHEWRRLPVLPGAPWPWILLCATVCPFLQFAYTHNTDINSKGILGGGHRDKRQIMKHNPGDGMLEYGGQ